MDLTVMSYVVNVAECGNFSQAAEACHVGQPALSQQIAKLERELGVPLFYRNPRGATTTEAGKEFVRRAREILNLSRDLTDQMSFYAGFQKGSLTLGLITSLQCIEFGDMLAAFVRNYPDIAVGIRQYGTFQLLDMLQERSVDLAFLNQPLEPLPPSVAFQELGTDRYGVAVPYDHPLARGKKVSLKQLKNDRFIFHQPWQVASELVLDACRKAGFEPNIICRSGMPSTSLYMVQGGLGIALFPEEEFTDRTLQDVVHLTLEEDIIKHVGVAWRKDSQSPLLQTMVKFAKEWCRTI